MLLSLLALLVAEPMLVSNSPAPGLAGVSFLEDFEGGAERWARRWEVLDPKTWRMQERGGSQRVEITARQSAYRPPHISPGHVMLVKDLVVGDLEITFRVRSTFDTGAHRDCCVFFGWQSRSQFYYVHLGAKPDPHSGQIMLVDNGPRRALTKNAKPFPWTDGWHLVRVTRDAGSGRIAVYFDDMKTPHMTVVDKTLTRGRVGIGSFDDLNAFDDVVVRGR